MAAVGPSRLFYFTTRSVRGYETSFSVRLDYKPFGTARTFFLGTPCMDVVWDNVCGGTTVEG